MPENRSCVRLRMALLLNFRCKKSSTNNCFLKNQRLTVERIVFHELNTLKHAVLNQYSAKNQVKNHQKTKNKLWNKQLLRKTNQKSANFRVLIGKLTQKQPFLRKKVKKRTSLTQKTAISGKPKPSLMPARPKLHRRKCFVKNKLRVTGNFVSSRENFGNGGDRLARDR